MKNTSRKKQFPNNQPQQRKRMKDPYRSRISAFSVAMLSISFLVSTSVRAAVIYVEDFDDVTVGQNASLGNTKPTVDNYLAGAATWSGHTGTDIQEDGDMIDNAGTRGGAWLPFVPTAGNVYSLSANLNPDSSASTDWLSLGFAVNNLDDRHNAVDGYAWALVRENTDDGSGFAGINTLGGFSFTDPGGSVDLEIVLDASDADPNFWGIEWKVNGSSVGQALPGTISGLDNINYVGFSKTGIASGSIDNFLLQDGQAGIHVLPEPSSLALLGMGLGVLMAARRRRCR